jgi:hypothetical protein
MKTSCNRLSGLSTTRRKFLKTTATLAGMTMFGHLDPKNVVYAGEKKEIITIRGHHLFDMLDALGTGKSSHKTLGPVAQKIRANPKVPLKIVVGMDDICSPCEWWDHDKMRCKRDMDKYPNDNENSFTSDKNAIRVLGMKEGDVMNADDIYRLIKTKVNQKVFAEEVCVACRVVNNCAKQYEKRIEAAVKALTEPGCVTS